VCDGVSALIRSLALAVGSTVSSNSSRGMQWPGFLQNATTRIHCPVGAGPCPSGAPALVMVAATVSFFIGFNVAARSVMHGFVVDLNALLAGGACSPFQLAYSVGNVFVSVHLVRSIGPENPGGSVMICGGVSFEMKTAQSAQFMADLKSGRFRRSLSGMVFPLLFWCGYVVLDEPDIADDELCARDYALKPDVEVERF